MPIEPVRLPRPSIGGYPTSEHDVDLLQSPKISMPQSTRSPPPMIRVYNPKTKETAIVDVQNARDMVRLDGWIMASSVKPAPSADDDLDDQKAKDVDDGDNGSSGEKETTDTSTEIVHDTSTELGAARAAYVELFGEQPDGRWGVKALKKALEDGPPKAENTNLEA